MEGGNGVTRESCGREEFVRVGGCVGCIDSWSVLDGYTSYDEVLGSLNMRYPAADCA